MLCSYVVHHGGKFDAVPNVHLKNIENFHQFTRWKLLIYTNTTIFSVTK